MVHPNTMTMEQIHLMEGTAYAAATRARLRAIRRRRRRRRRPCMLSLPPTPPHSDFYRKRFESSVLGDHAMLPPPEVAERLRYPNEEPAAYPSGPNTSFCDPTPMPRRFADDGLQERNMRDTVGGITAHKSSGKNAIYRTTSSEIGLLGITSSDLPMRWYGRTGNFTNSWVAPPKTKVNTGLNTATDMSNVHHIYDQGWSGHLGLTSFNVANHKAATFVGKDARTTYS